MTDESICKKAVDLLLKASPPGSLVILFGSQATGRAKPDSDWDFLVVEPEATNRFEEMARLSAILGESLIPADVMVLSRQAFEYWQSAPNSLPFRAKKEGLVYESLL